MLVVWPVYDVLNPRIPVMHPNLGDAREDTWDRPDKDGRTGKCRASLGQILGKSK
jgi:hypothetical protein